MARGDTAGCRFIQIASLDPRVDEALLRSVLSTAVGAGQILSIRIVHDRHGTKGGLSLAFVEFSDHSVAEAAIVSLFGRQIFDRQVALSWAINHSSRPKEDTSSHFHIWIGDISGNVDDLQLIRHFSPYKSLSDLKIMYDPDTGKTRCYGFASFRDKQDAERAITELNNTVIGNKALRLNWAHNKNAAHINPAALDMNAAAAGSSGVYSSAPAFEHPKRPTLNYNSVMGQASPANVNVYLGNLPPSITQDQLHTIFNPYGYVAEIKCHADRGFAFVKMGTHEAAAQAICYLQGAPFAGQKLRASWGKDPAGATHRGQGFAEVQQQRQQQHQFYSQAGYNGYQQMPGYGANAYAYQQQYAAYDPATYAAYYAQYQAAMEAQQQQYYQQQQQDQQEPTHQQSATEAQQTSSSQPQ